MNKKKLFIYLVKIEKHSLTTLSTKKVKSSFTSEDVFVFLLYCTISPELMLSLKFINIEEFS